MNADLLAKGLAADVYAEAHPTPRAGVTYRVVSASEPAALTFSASTGSGEVSIPLPTGWVDARYVAPWLQGPDRNLAFVTPQRRCTRRRHPVRPLVIETCARKV